jgi:hypothetical protein
VKIIGEPDFGSHAAPPPADLGPSGRPSSELVILETSTGIEIVELIGVASPAMFPMLLSLLRSFGLYFQSRADLQIEILALRHQIVVLQRQAPEPKLKSADRRFWVGLSQILVGHRRGFRWYWT